MDKQRRRATSKGSYSGWRVQLGHNIDAVSALATLGYPMLASVAKSFASRPGQRALDTGRGRYHSRMPAERGDRVERDRPPLRREAREAVPRPVVEPLGPGHQQALLDGGRGQGPCRRPQALRERLGENSQASSRKVRVLLKVWVEGDHHQFLATWHGSMHDCSPPKKDPSLSRLT